MREKVCYKCGKPVYMDGLCRECWEKEQIPEKIKVSEIRMCRVCGKVFHPKRRTYVDISPEDLVHELTGLHAERKQNMVVVKLRNHDKQIPIRKGMCLVCSRKSGNYHEAKIQIRDGLDFLLDFVPEDEIVKIEKLKEGYDVLLLSKAGAKYFISLVKDKYFVKFSRKLIGEKNGRQVYRDVYVVRKWKDR